MQRVGNWLLQRAGNLILVCSKRESLVQADSGKDKWSYSACNSVTLIKRSRRDGQSHVKLAIYMWQEQGENITADDLDPS